MASSKSHEKTPARAKSTPRSRAKPVHGDTEGASPAPKRKRRARATEPPGADAVENCPQKHARRLSPVSPCLRKDTPPERGQRAAGDRTGAMVESVSPVVSGEDDGTGLESGGEETDAEIGEEEEGPPLRLPEGSADALCIPWSIAHDLKPYQVRVRGGLGLGCVCEDLLSRLGLCIRHSLLHYGSTTCPRPSSRLFAPPSSTHPCLPSLSSLFLSLLTFSVTITLYTSLVPFLDNPPPLQLDASAMPPSLSPSLPLSPAAG